LVTELVEETTSENAELLAKIREMEVELSVWKNAVNAASIRDAKARDGPIGNVGHTSINIDGVSFPTRWMALDGRIGISRY